MFYLVPSRWAFFEGRVGVGKDSIPIDSKYNETTSQEDVLVRSDRTLEWQEGLAVLHVLRCSVELNGDIDWVRGSQREQSFSAVDRR
jgi:hypothetical protein